MRNAMKRYALLFFALLIWRSISAQSVTITPPVAYINQGESVTLTASGATFISGVPQQDCRIQKVLLLWLLLL